MVEPLLFKSVNSARIQHRLSLPTAEGVLARDNRGIVLLLRSFQDDDFPSFKGPLRSAIFARDLTFEELTTHQLWGFGPVVAVGRPRESLPPAGAAREYVSDDVWQTVIGRLTEEAALIVMILGATPGFGWKLRNLIDRNLLHKVLLIMPPFPPEMLARRTRVLVEEFGLKSASAAFLRSAFVPDVYCVVGMQNGFAVLRARSNTSFGYGVAIDIGARTILRQSSEGHTEH
jgi:hypothetical protein